ncbi:MAG: hypothetical protein R3C15_15500 [Thermoleophilia bacterium]
MAPEFTNDAQKAAHVAALEAEIQGYKARLGLAKQGRDRLPEAELKSRIAQVEAELERIESLDETDDEPVEEKPRRRRAAKPAEQKPEAEKKEPGTEPPAA